MSVKPDTIIEELKKGLYHTNRYRIEFTPPKGVGGGGVGADVINILCDSVSIPGKQIATSEYSLHRQVMKIPYAYSHEDISITFIVSDEYKIKKMFDKWLSIILDPETYTLSYDEEYRTDIKIMQLGREDDTEAIYEVTAMNAFPFTESTITLSNTSENEIVKMTYTFAYDDIKITDK